MHIDGSCHCGGITFEAEIDPERVGICHCTDCQTMSGAPYNAVVPVRETDFTMKSGTPKVYVKTAENGNRRNQLFCPDCGTRIYATSHEDPTDGKPRLFSVRMGIVRQKAEIRPRWQVWTRSAQPWVKDLDAIPAHDTQAAPPS